MGSVFTVVLPAAHGEEARAATPSRAEPEVKPQEDAQPLPKLTGVSILVVEDQPDTLALLLRLLGSLGAKVTGVNTTRAALTELQQKVPDLLISDLGLPGEDGYALIERLRSLPPSSCCAPWGGTRVPPLKRRCRVAPTASPISQVCGSRAARAPGSGKTPTTGSASAARARIPARRRASARSR
jgi:CheY-like chemotaxis protein